MTRSLSLCEMVCAVCKPYAMQREISCLFMGQLVLAERRKWAQHSKCPLHIPIQFDRSRIYRTMQYSG